MKNRIAAGFFTIAISIILASAMPLHAQALYSPAQYPTAQGNYLQLPSSYPKQASPSVAPAPSAPMAPPRYVAAVATPVAAPIDVPARESPPVYQQVPSTSAPARAATPSSYSEMPSYHYNPATDPAHPPYKTPIAHDSAVASSGIGLETISGFEVGAEISDYRYQEFDPSGASFMRITGPTIGVLADFTKAYRSGWFMTGDLRISYGLHDYTGGDVIISGPSAGSVIPSTHNGIDDWMFDIRAVGGHDFILRDSFWGLVDVDLSPYAGLGFRYLYDDSRGDDSNGVQGYERYSHYLYLPFGNTTRFRLTDNSRLSVNMEYDYLITGWQISSLGDAIPGVTDVTDTQNTGYGLRGSVMYERHSWSVGPFFEFWDIGQSSTDCNNALCGDEPHNQTIEFGVEGRYRL